MLGKIARGHYTPNPRPPKPQKRCPKCHIAFSSNFCGNCGNPVTDWYNHEISVYTEDLSEHRKNAELLEEKFKKDCLVEFGIQNHPKAEKLFQLVYDKFSGEGLIEVYYKLEYFSALLTD